MMGEDYAEGNDDCRELIGLRAWISILILNGNRFGKICIFQHQHQVRAQKHCKIHIYLYQNSGTSWVITLLMDNASNFISGLCGLFQNRKDQQAVEINMTQEENENFFGWIYRGRCLNNTYTSNNTRRLDTSKPNGT